MGRGTWQVTVHGVAESDMTEQLTLSLSFHVYYMDMFSNIHVFYA